MRNVLLLVLLSAAPVWANTDVSVARAALRDGLWSIARQHAAELPQDEGRLVTLESYAKESKWSDILSSLEKWGCLQSPQYAIYQAYALAQMKRVDEAIHVLGNTTFPTEKEQKRAMALQVALLLKQGRAKEALARSDKAALEKGDFEEQFLAAQAAYTNGETNQAVAIWRAEAQNPAAPESLRVNAALLTDDRAVMTNVLAHVNQDAARNQLQIRLALHDLSDSNKWTLAAGVIREAARQQPDRADVQPAFLSYARAALLAGRAEESVEAYRNALEIWPSLAQNASVQEARGWASRRLGRVDAALDAYLSAEKSATNVLQRANIALARGDTLAEAGRADEAMACYRLVLSQYPETPAGKKLAVLLKHKEMEVRGRELYRAFQFDAARRIFGELAKEDPSCADKMAYLDVLCLYGLNRDAEAVAKAQTLSLHAKDALARLKALHWLAKYAYSQARWKDASALFEDYAKESPASADAPAALIWAARAAYAEGDFERAIKLSTWRLKEWPNAPGRASAYVVQGEALIALARFEEAILVLDRASGSPSEALGERRAARMLKADALFAMGADNPARYEEALLAYHMVVQGEVLTPSRRLVVSYKIARTLEKMGRLDAARDEYYTSVILAYRSGRLNGETFDDAARAVFVKAAFHLAQDFEQRGLKMQAERILELVAASDVPAAAEAERRIDRLQTGGFQP